jgi:hypothetical protein
MAVKGGHMDVRCFACFRSERDRLRARAQAAEEAADDAKGRAAAPGDPFRSTRTVTMTPAQRAHRFRMLTHLRRAGSSR